MLRTRKQLGLPYSQGLHLGSRLIALGDQIWEVCERARKKWHQFVKRELLRAVLYYRVYNQDLVSDWIKI